MIISSINSLLMASAKLIASLFIWHDLKSSHDKLNYDKHKNLILNSNKVQLKEYIVYIASEDRHLGVTRHFDIKGVLGSLQDEYQVIIEDDIKNSDEVNKVLHQLVADGGVIKALIINTHGSASNLYFTPDGKPFKVENLHFELLAKDALIVLNACNAGRPVERPNYNIAEYVAKLAGPSRRVISPKLYHHIQNLRLTQVRPLDFSMNPFGVTLLPDYSYQPDYQELPPIDQLSIYPERPDSDYELNLKYSTVGSYTLYILYICFCYLLQVSTCFLVNVLCSNYSPLEKDILAHRYFPMLSKLEDGKEWRLKSLRLAVENHNTFAIHSLLNHRAQCDISDHSYDRQLRSFLIHLFSDAQFSTIYPIFIRHGINLNHLNIDNGIKILSGSIHLLFKFFFVAFTLFKLLSLPSVLKLIPAFTHPYLVTIPVIASTLLLSKTFKQRFNALLTVFNFQYSTPYPIIPWHPLDKDLRISDFQQVLDTVEQKQEVASHLPLFKLKKRTQPLKSEAGPNHHDNQRKIGKKKTRPTCNKR